MDDTKTSMNKAAEALNEFNKVEPWLATIIPIVFPPAAPVMPLVNAFAPAILTFAARALSDIAASNGGDLPAALIELFQHVSKGQPNSPILSSVALSSVKPDMPPPPSSS